MFQNPEQFANATKTLFEFQLETFNTLTNRAMQGVEQAVALNIATAKKHWMTRSRRAAKSMPRPRPRKRWM